MSEQQKKAVIEKYVREALSIRAKKKVSERLVKKVSKEVYETASRALRAA
jgi:uncharacterized Zn finger protein